MNLSNANIIVKIDNYEINRNIDIEACSSESDLFCWAKLQINNNLLNKLNISKDSEVSIFIGYEEIYHNIFIGNVDSINNNIVLCKDNMIKLNNLNFAH